MEGRLQDLHVVQSACGRDIRRDAAEGVGGDPARPSKLQDSSWTMSSGQSRASKGFNQGNNVVCLYLKVLCSSGNGLE